MPRTESLPDPPRPRCFHYRGFTLKPRTPAAAHPSQAARLIAMLARSESRLRNLAEERDRLRALTPDQIQRVAQKYLNPGGLAVLAVGEVDAMLKGNPDKPQFSIGKLTGGKEVTIIPLPDPLTMVYPETK